MIKNSNGVTALEAVIMIWMVITLVGIGNALYEDALFRSRSIEAKIELAALYSAERSYHTVNGTFTPCLADAGYSPHAEPRYFTIGFSREVGASARCAHHDPLMVKGIDYAYSASEGMPGSELSIPSPDELSSIEGLSVSQTTFVAGALNHLSRPSHCDAKLSGWTIDENKNLKLIDPCALKPLASAGR